MPFFDKLGLKSRKERSNSSQSNQDVYEQAIEFIKRLSRNENTTFEEKVIISLDNTLIRNILMQEAKKNFGEENILFLMTYKDYLSHPSESKYEQIVDLYIKESSARQVNIDSKQKNNCLNALQDINKAKNALDPVASSVSKLMWQNSPLLQKEDKDRFGNLIDKINKLKNESRINESRVKESVKPNPSKFFSDFKEKAIERLRKLKSSFNNNKKNKP